MIRLTIVEPPITGLVHVVCMEWFDWDDKKWKVLGEVPSKSGDLIDLVWDGIKIAQVFIHT
jgi:hypothetical protein